MKDWHIRFEKAECIHGLSVTCSCSFPQLYMHVSDQRERPLIAVDFISPNLISSGVFPSCLQIDPVSFQEGRRPIKPVRIRVAACGCGSCSRTFWRQALIGHFCESRNSGKGEGAGFKIFDWWLSDTTWNHKSQHVCSFGQRRTGPWLSLFFLPISVTWWSLGFLPLLHLSLLNSGLKDT